MNEGEICAKHFSTGKPVRIRWKSGKFTSIEEISSAPENLWVAPTLFDVQVNGYGGIDFQQDDVTADELLSAATVVVYLLKSAQETGLPVRAEHRT